MTRRRAALISLVWLTLLPLPASASLGGAALGSEGYVDTGFDAEDRPYDETSPTAQDPDISSTTRRVQPRPRGGSWLVVGFRTYDWIVGYWGVRVNLDTRKGPEADFLMRFVDTGVGPVWCQVRRVDDWPWRKGIFWIDWYAPDQVKCRVPLQWVWPTKRIRWNLSSPPGGEGEPGIWEFAPGRGGWYPSR